MIPPESIQPGVSLWCANGAVLRVDSLQPGYVHYTPTAYPSWPRHVGKSFIACPRWLGMRAMRVIPAPEPQETEEVASC